MNLFVYKKDIVPKENHFYLHLKFKINIRMKRIFKVIYLMEWTIKFK